MYSYTYNRQQRRLARKKSAFLITFTILLLVFAVWFTVSRTVNSEGAKTPPENTLKSSENQSPSPKPIDSSLSTIIQNSLTDSTGTYGVYIKNLQDNQSFYQLEHKSFKTGSLYKLWIMAVVYDQIQKGVLTEDQILSADIRTLNQKFDIDPDLAELTDGSITLSVQSALNQMITISHNYAALLLTEKVKLSTIATFLSQNGFKQSSVGTDGSNPTSTASDIGLFFEKLYRGELANAKYTKEMIDLLKNQHLNNKLPKYLPQEVSIAHKTGEFETFSHDAGLVYIPNGGYIIAILSESDNPAGAEDRIAQISKSVYDYFTKP